MFTCFSNDVSELNKTVKKLCETNDKLKVETQQDLRKLKSSIFLTTEGVKANSVRIQEYNDILRRSEPVHTATAQGLRGELQYLTRSLVKTRESDADVDFKCEKFLETMDQYVETLRNAQTLPTDLGNQISNCVHQFHTELRMLEIQEESRKLQNEILHSMKDRVSELQSWEATLGGSAQMISQQLQMLSSSLDYFAKEGQTLSSCQSFLKRLHYNTINSRKRTIENAHSLTFEWIFTEPDKDVETFQQHHRFVHWLRGETKPFWIQGKAGSGKSTLMKFIVGHPETLRHLQFWAGDKELVVASFYFWNAGTLLQKSQEGLLRSLLFEIFRKCPELVLPVREKLKLFDEIEDLESPWSFDELLAMYKTILEKNIRRRFCFFIDGLDEFQGASNGHRDLIKTLRDLDGSIDIKLCLSSRPWMVFEDEFGEEAMWYLKLQNLTKDDMRQVVSDKFRAHPHFIKLQKSKTPDPEIKQYHEVMAQVVNRSQGVFLWVHLVLRNLLDGLTFGDSMQTLQARLEAFPEDLDSFFQHMLDSIPKIYLPRAARMFKIALSAEKPLFLLFYSLLQELEEHDVITIDQPIYGMPSSEVERRKHRMRRILDGRSRGLLEVASDDEGVPVYLQDKVDFLHRTVRDFLKESGTPFLRDENDCAEVDVSLLSCKAALAMMRRVPTGAKEPMRIWGPLFELFFFFCNKASQQPGTLDALRDLLTRVEDTFEWIIQFRCLPTTITSQYLLSYACQYQVRFYIEWKLSQTWYPSVLLRHPECPALDFALSGARPSAETVRLLLRYGADPNQPFRNTTIWARFMTTISNVQERDHFRNKEEDFEVVRCLLLAGARMNEDLRNGSNNMTAVAVIKRYFPAPQATILLGCRPTWTRMVTSFWRW